MPWKTVLAKTIAATGMIAMSVALPCAPTWAHGASLSSVDTDHDGAVSLKEAHEAATKKFDTMDTQHTGKLTQAQVSPMSRAIREMARHDKDHMIDKDEYMAGVDAAFKEADPTGSGVLNAKALKTKAGRHFLELVE